MTGDYESVIGMAKEAPVRRFLTKLPGARMEPATGPATLCAVAVETAPNGLAERIAPVRIGGRLAPALPDFW
jgi:calcineurin-like phosphoesterase